jgi:hypothetical protein
MCNFKCYAKDSFNFKFKVKSLEFLLRICIP